VIPVRLHAPWRRRNGRRRARSSLAAFVLAVALASGAAAADLPEIRERGTIRMLVLSGDDDAVLPRRGWRPNEDRALARAFASELGLAVERVWVEEEDDLIPALLEGRADLVADGLAITDERRRQVAFTAPFLSVREQVVTRAADTELRRRSQLQTRRIAAHPSLGHWQNVERLKQAYPRMTIEEVGDPIGMDELVEGVAEERFDLTLAGRNFVQEYTAHRDDLRMAFAVGDEVLVGWALSKDATALRRAADRFITRQERAADGDAPFTGDLDAIRERGVLRVLTRNAPTTYYSWRGRLVGYEFEMFRALSKHLGVRLEIVVPTRVNDLIPWLLEGRGDLIAAGLPGDPALLDAKILATRPYRQVRVEIVGPADAASLETPEDLAGRPVSLAPGSITERLVERLAARGIALEVVRAPEDHEAEELIDDVATGRAGLTLVGSDMLATQLLWRNDVKSVLTLGPPVDLAWSVRPGSPELLAAADAFLADPKRAGAHAAIAQRYFERPSRARASGRAHPPSGEHISPFDDLLQRWGGRYGFDWRLLAAQMFQESAFNPEATSHVGAYGLMQLMPGTADQMGIDGWKQPAGNIQAGTKYMAWVRDRFAGELRPEDRNWLSLAAYNAGVGHVYDARLLAEEAGLDPNRWFDHVERAMLWKRDPKIYRKTRYGYCRGSEPVDYVRRIRNLYRGYVQSIPFD